VILKRLSQPIEQTKDLTQRDDRPASASSARSTRRWASIGPSPRIVRRGGGARSTSSDSLWSDRALVLAGATFAVLIALAVAGPLVWTANPDHVQLLHALEAPSWAHPMGTDADGRDVLARFDRGAGISLLAGAAVVVVGAVVGGALGVTAGMSRGWLDSVLMRLMDALLAFPPLILAMAVTIGLGVGIVTACIGIALTSVPWYARLLRSDVLRIRSLPFVESARATGASRADIVRHHVLPHVVSTLLIQAAGVFGYTIIALAALGFVGLGAQIPTPEWGAMITDGLQYSLTGQWWLTVFPGLGLLVAVSAANVIADRLRDRLDPRGKYMYV
jgi:peptide/nickel transport system permease protein